MMQKLRGGTQKLFRALTLHVWSMDVSPFMCYRTHMMSCVMWSLNHCGSAVDGETELGLHHRYFKKQQFNTDCFHWSLNVSIIKIRMDILIPPRFSRKTNEIMHETPGSALWSRGCFVRF